MRAKEKLHSLTVSLACVLSGYAAISFASASPVERRARSGSSFSSRFSSFRASNRFSSFRARSPSNESRVVTRDYTSPTYGSRKLRSHSRGTPKSSPPTTGTTGISLDTKKSIKAPTPSKASSLQSEVLGGESDQKTPATTTTATTTTATTATAAATTTSQVTTTTATTASVEEKTTIDYVGLPAVLDQQFLAVDKDNALRSAKLSLGEVWTKRYQKSVLAAVETETMSEKEQETHKKQAFDLLDALTRSGDIPLEHSDLHIILPVAHSFQQDLLDTLVKRNINPVEKVERSVCLLSGVVHRAPVSQLIAPGQAQRLQLEAPELFAAHMAIGDAD
eukprot:g12445.t1